MNETYQTDGEVSETIVEAIDEAGEQAASKHKRLVVEIDGVQCERIWGYAYFPTTQVREFTQYCRDTERKINDLIAPIILAGVADLFGSQITPTASQREESRKARLPNSEEAVAKAEAKLLAQHEKIAVKLAAVKERAAALRAAAFPAQAEPDTDGLGPEPEHSRHQHHGRHGRGH